jgi:hypothetical protein
MKQPTYLLLIFLLTSVNTKASEICSALLDNGIRDNFSVLTTDDRFQLYQTALCNEDYQTYDSFASSVKDSNLSIKTAKGILGLSGSSDKVRQHFEEKYSKFCSASLAVSDTKSRFISKNSIINNNLTKGFNECVKTISSFKADQGLNVYVDVTPQSNFSAFSVRVDRNSASETSIDNILPSTVTCSIGGVDIALPYTIKSAKFSLECRKPPKTLASFQINTTGEGYSNEVSIPAEKDRLHEVEARLEYMEELLRISSPQKVILAVASNTCPDGWIDYAPAYGRFVRGIDKTNARVDIDGKRDFGTHQGDMVKKHTHKATYRRGKDNDSNGGGHNHEVTDGTRDETITTDSCGNCGNENRPKNVALLYCQKKSY